MFKIRIDSESLDFRKGSHWTLAGFALELVGSVAGIPRGTVFSSPAGLAALLTGTAFIIVGTHYLAISKGRSPAWAALGLFGIFGWIALAFMEDHTDVATEEPAPV